MANLVQAVIQGNQNTTKLINQLKADPKQYPALDKASERKMIEKYRGNREKLNHLLFMHNIKMVFNMAKKYTSKTRDFDNLVQNGMKGLAEAAVRFDLDKGIKFDTYAHWWIKKYLLSIFDPVKTKIERSSISLDLPALQGSSNSSDQSPKYENFVHDYIDPTVQQPRTIHEELSANEQQEICNQLYERIEADNSLSAMDKQLFTEMFQNREKTRDLALKYGLDQREVGQIRKTILEKCRGILENEMHITSFSQFE